MTVTDERVAKLPGWAQRLIDRMERDLAYYRERERARDSGETKVEVLDLTREGSWHLNDNTTVRWTLPYDARDGRPASVEVRLNLAGELRVSSNGGGLIVRPHVSNVVVVDVDPL